MIAIAGGTGRLGRSLTLRLLDRGVSVRILTRSAGHVPPDLAERVEVVEADVTVPSSLAPAVAGAGVVVSAITGFGGPGAQGATRVDGDGNVALISAAEAAGVDRFILLSVLGASRTSPVGLFRAKASAEARLRASRLGWTFVRPTAYAETWLELVGRPIAETGRTRVFGRGQNPINFVSAEDVAAVVARIALDDGWRGREIDVAGPDNLTFDALAAAAADAFGRAVRVDHTPPMAMRLLAALMGPVRPLLADQIRAAILMDSADMRADTSARRAAFPDIPMTSIAEVAATMFSPATPAVAPLSRGSV